MNSQAMAALCDLTKSQSSNYEKQAASAPVVKPSVGAPIDASGIDWREVISLARRHRVEGLVARYLISNNVEVSDDVWTHFIARLREQASAALLSAGALTKIAQSFNEIGIDFVLLKGHAVSDRFYPSWFDRQSIDIDILVDPTRVDGAQEVLEQLGFVVAEPIALDQNCRQLFRWLRSDIGMEHPQCGVRVELHWRIKHNPRLLPWTFSEALELCDHLQIGPATLRVFSPPVLLVYLIAHGAAHGWCRLKWLADIERLVPTLSERELKVACDLARRSGIVKIFTTSLNLVQIKYGLKLNHVVNNASKGKSDRWLLRHMLRLIHGPEMKTSKSISDLPKVVSDLHYSMLLRPEFGYRATELARFLVDARDLATLRLSHRWLWLYILVGPFLSIGRVVRRSFFKHCSGLES